MKSIPESNRYEQPLNGGHHCQECNEGAFGRCPDCGRGFCLEHFPIRQHSPCAEKHMKLSHKQACYVCGAQVFPDQWSVSQISHYIDQAKCHGCGRYICDDLHTQSKSEQVTIVHQGLRGYRYQYIIRYCDLCHAFRGIGGIKRAVQGIVVIGTIAAGLFFYFHP